MFIQLILLSSISLHTVNRENYSKYEKHIGQFKEKHIGYISSTHCCSKSPFEDFKFSHFSVDHLSRVPNMLLEREITKIRLMSNYCSSIGMSRQVWCQRIPKTYDTLHISIKKSIKTINFHQISQFWSFLSFLMVQMESMMTLNGTRGQVWSCTIRKYSIWPHVISKSPLKYKIFQKNP